MSLCQRVLRARHIHKPVASVLTASWLPDQNKIRIGDQSTRGITTTWAAPRHPDCNRKTPIFSSYRRFNPHIEPIPHKNIQSTINASPATFSIKRSMSDEIRRGTDLLADSLAHGPRRKIILESYAPSGVDVKGLVEVGDVPAEGDLTGGDKIVHMNGSIVAFPDACFLWNVTTPEEVTLASLSVVKLYRPMVEYLFIGCDTPVSPPEMRKIKREFRKKDIIVEQMDIMNAMGTFNILNGEDRRVACVLVVNPDDES